MANESERMYLASTGTPTPVTAVATVVIIVIAITSVSVDAPRVRCDFSPHLGTPQ